MDVKALLRAQMTENHNILEAAIGDCSPEILANRLDGATINAPGSLYAHTVFGEDGLLNGLVRGTTPVYYAGGWADKIGIDMPQGAMEPDWNVDLDLAQFREYAQAVYRATDEYIAGADDAELERVIDPGFAPATPVATFITNILIWHVATHQGEISAIKGVQGLNGLDFSH